MENVNAPLLISSESITDDISDMSEIFYHINHIASANTWYHRQLEEDSESLLSTLKGNHTNSLVQNELSIHVNDMINIYLVNKNYILNGGCHTKTHLMITLNFDIFDQLFSLNKHNLKFLDLINIEEKINSKETKMLYMIDFSANNEVLRFNLLNYEKNIYRYLKRILWLDDQFVDIKIFDIYENDITSNILEYIKRESDDNVINNDRTIIPTTPIKKQKKIKT
tara:strand:+ start:1326 stop:1997 length:672 start_codon:yes stop_codon:yes gene_type:complete